MAETPGEKIAALRRLLAQGNEASSEDLDEAKKKLALEGAALTRLGAKIEEIRREKAHLESSWLTGFLLHLAGTKTIRMREARDALAKGEAELAEGRDRVDALRRRMGVLETGRTGKMQWNAELKALLATETARISAGDGEAAKKLTALKARLEEGDSALGLWQVAMGAAEEAAEAFEWCGTEINSACETTANTYAYEADKASFKLPSGILMGYEGQVKKAQECVSKLLQSLEALPEHGLGDEGAEIEEAWKQAGQVSPMELTDAATSPLGMEATTVGQYLKRIEALTAKARSLLDSVRTEVDRARAARDEAAAARMDFIEDLSRLRDTVPPGA